MPKGHITEKNAYAYINATLKALGRDNLLGLPAASNQGQAIDGES